MLLDSVEVAVLVASKSSDTGIPRGQPHCHLYNSAQLRGHRVLAVTDTVVCAKSPTCTERRDEGHQELTELTPLHIVENSGCSK